MTTEKLVTLFCDAWGGISWKNVAEGGAVHEANFLMLDCSWIKAVFGIEPVWDVAEAVGKTVEWSKCWQGGGDINACMEKQIKEYLEGTRHV